MKDILSLQSWIMKLNHNAKLIWIESKQIIPKAKAWNWSITSVCEMNFKYDLKINLCLSPQFTLHLSEPAYEVIHPTFFSKNYIFSSTRTSHKIAPLPLIIPSMLFYMYWLDKKIYVWWYFTCKHVYLF